MSLDKQSETNKNLVVESGIITPNLFKGVLGIPEDEEFIKEETLFADALYEILNSDVYSKNLKQNSNNLLEKFNLEQVAIEYLNNKIE